MTAAKIENVRVYVARFADYLELYSSWGSLHVVLADDNFEDGHVRFCLERAREKQDAEGAELADLLLRMSRTQRGKVARLAGEEVARRSNG